MSDATPLAATQQEPDAEYHSPLSHAELRMWVGGHSKPDDPNYVLTIDGSVLPLEAANAVEDEIRRRWQDGLRQAEVAMWEQGQDPDDRPHEIVGVSCSGPDTKGRTGVDSAASYASEATKIHWEGECKCVGDGHE